MRFAAACVALAAFIAAAFTASAADGSRRMVAFYNLEDLFDTINDPHTADEDMLPLADRRWNTERYRTKLRNLARVIADMSAECGFPAVIGVAEAENRAVLEDLASEPAIAAAGYAVCHYDSPDARGIDVGFLYRPDVFRFEGSMRVRALPHEEGVRTRDYVAMWGRMDGKRLWLVGVHWPSRIGGKRAEALREACGREVRALADSVRRADPEAGVIVMGDMNDEPSDASVASALGAKRGFRRLRAGDMYNPFAAKRRAGRGSYRFDRRWNMLDQIVVSADLAPEAAGGPLRLRRTESGGYGAVFRRRYMFLRGEPFATYEGSDYTGGYSDHLPVYVVLGAE